MSNPLSKGAIILLTGISGSGKTTLGTRLQHQLTNKTGCHVEFIDGDVVRDFLNGVLGYTEEDRFQITKIIVYTAYMLSRNGISVIVANIAGKRYVQEYMMKKWRHHTTILLDADVQDCIQNDPKGIYKTALQKNTPSLLGVDIPYDKPKNPDLIIQTYKEDVDDSLNRILMFLSASHAHSLSV